MGSLTRIVVFVAAVWAAGVPGACAADGPVVVFAAASLTSALRDVDKMAKANGLPGCRCVFAASSALARQIGNGAPADIFISANLQWMDHVASLRAIATASRRVLVSNKLILVAPRIAPFTLPAWRPAAVRAVLNGGWLAMGDPDHVPAGQYGAAALKHLQLWSALKSRIARAANVRGALALVARGEAAAGIVYASDRHVSEDVVTVSDVPADSHPPIVYPAALTPRGAGRETARSFFAFLFSPAVQARFARHGFVAADGS